MVINLGVDYRVRNRLQEPGFQLVPNLATVGNPCREPLRLWFKDRTIETKFDLEEIRATRRLLLPKSLAVGNHNQVQLWLKVRIVQIVLRLAEIRADLPRYQLRLWRRDRTIQMLSGLVEHVQVLGKEIQVIVRLAVAQAISKANGRTRNEKRGRGDEGRWEEGFDLAVYGYGCR